jgi:hypothetical protein
MLSSQPARQVNVLGMHRVGCLRAMGDPDSRNTFAPKVQNAQIRKSWFLQVAHHGERHTAL